MQKNKQSDPCCANFIARSIFASFEEILGREEFQLVLHQAQLDSYRYAYPPQNLENTFPLHDLKKLFNTISQLYGERSSRGLIFRAGRAWFNRLYHQQSPALGFGSLEFITLPRKLKHQRSAQMLARYFSRFGDWHFQTGLDGAFVIWQLDCPLDDNPAVAVNFMDLFLGFWQEALYWLSGGKTYVFEPVVRKLGEAFPAQISIPTIPID